MELRDPQSFERLTGAAFFTPAGAGSAIHLGNVEMLRLDYGLKSFDILRSRRGVVSTRKRVFYGRAPMFSIQLNQFTTATQFLHLAGTRQADLVQVATSNAMFVFTATPGGAWSLGKSEIWLRSVKAAGQVKVEGYDYYLDAYNGWLWLPSQGGTIETGQAVTVAYDYPALTLESYSAVDQLSFDGQLVVYAEDTFGPPARERWEMQVTLSAKGLPDTDPGKFRSATLEAMIYGNPQVYKRGQAKAFDEITTADGTVLDLS